MASHLESYGTGSGIPLGVGVGAVAATLAGVQSEFAVVTGFGVLGGIVAGGLAGRYTGASLGHENWAYRVVAYTLFVSLLVGGLLGALSAWMVDASMPAGFLAGGAAGGAFGLLLSGVLVAAGRKHQAVEAAATVNESTV